MTSLKSNIDNFFSKKSLENSDSKKSLKFLKIFNQSNDKASRNDHKSLIEQIYLKNDALNKHSNMHNHKIANHPNYLTFCQKYASILYQKYNNHPMQRSKTSQNIKIKNQENIELRTQNSSQIFSKNVIILRKYYQNNQHQFTKLYQDLSSKAQKIRTYLQQRNKSIQQKDTYIQEELKVLNLFMAKMNKKQSKQHITPFTLFIDEAKWKNKGFEKIDRLENLSPQKVQKVKGTLFDDQKSQRVRHYHKTPEEKYSNKQKKMFISNILTPKSPDLLSGIRDKDSINKQLLISFKKNMQNSQIGCQTLKYSESQLNINIDKYEHNKARDQGSQQSEENEVPYSPVHPYRLHNLETVQKNKVIDADTIKQSLIGDQALKYQKHQKHQNRQKFSHYEKQQSKDQEQQQQLIVFLFEFQSFSKPLFVAQSNSIERVYTILSQSTNQLFPLFQKSQYSIQQQKQIQNKQWNQCLQILGKQIQDLQIQLKLQKQERDIKDKKFLQNLQLIQNQMIQDIFEQKQNRKQQENILTQMLSNLIDTIQSKRK